MADLPSHEPARRYPGCEMCSRRKTKCEFDRPGLPCVQCIRRKTRCVSGVPSRRERMTRRESLKRSQYVRALEERLRQTESLLRAAGIIADEDGSEMADLAYDDEGEDQEEDSEEGDDDDDDDDEMDDASHTIEYPESLASTGLSTRSSTAPESTDRRPSETDEMSISIFKMDGRKSEEDRYIGRASSLSILSQRGIEWIKSKTGDTSFLKLLHTESSHDSPWDYWRPDVFHDLFASKVFKPLPPRAEVFALLSDYFRTVNRLFPLYHEASFMRLVEWQYTQQTCDDAARWASINIIISLAYEYRFSNSLKPERDKERAWMYFKNSLSVFSELALRRTDLLSIQALLGMALFLRGNSGTQSVLPLVTAAMRSCQRLGLHRNVPRSNLSAAEREQRKRVFWIAYILDQGTCIRSGSAPSQHADDIDIGFPESIEDDTTSPHPCNISFFSQLSHLSWIRSRIYGRLYSTRSLDQMPEEACATVVELSRELEEWRRDHPFEMHVKQRPSGKDFLLGFASIGIQLVYYNALIMVNRFPSLLCLCYRSDPMNASSMRHITPQLAKQTSTSTAICMQAARDTLALVNSMPWGDIAWIWSLLYYVFHAVMTLFINLLRDSKHPKAWDDLQLLNMAATFFSTLMPADGPHNHVRFMTKMSLNFERIARSIVEKEGKEIKSRDHESVPVASAKRSPTTTIATHPPPLSKTISPSPPLHPPQTAIPARPADTTTPPDHIQIPPHIEGLPRINSVGYVVPESPISSEGHPSPISHPPSNNNNNNNNNNNAFMLGAPHILPTTNTGNNNINNSRIPISAPPLEYGLPFFADNVVPDFWAIPAPADDFLNISSSSSSSYHPHSHGLHGTPINTNEHMQPSFHHQPNINNIPLHNPAAPSTSYTDMPMDPNPGAGPFWAQGFLNFF
ncbi:hypothetical protein ASPZODRAFT_15606 [Penicilliopsis zonata CBS 506.65]|uniref:Zn(2)-C6 fungal-type domain-containing protein n=1 Tax=Penicilliopsis zonata CBS 506.65 TaxID=1073090 RepID=A0A1L9SIH6_9EURO|nr:hypothetical protein ASPZODRAFT_15606 [Penicilliopsis zonata CBS 506.65]OJJ46916.1 hypothetical protein ASPZODRAFT_15606 [Penicilliopsis zonata CBS 506.65]